MEAITSTAVGKKTESPEPHSQRVVIDQSERNPNDSVIFKIFGESLANSQSEKQARNSKIITFGGSKSKRRL